MVWNCITLSCTKNVIWLHRKTCGNDMFLPMWPNFFVCYLLWCTLCGFLESRLQIIYKLVHCIGSKVTAFSTYLGRMISLRLIKRANFHKSMNLSLQKLQQKKLSRNNVWDWYIGHIQIHIDSIYRGRQN